MKYKLRRIHDKYNEIVSILNLVMKYVLWESGGILHQHIIGIDWKVSLTNTQTYVYDMYAYACICGCTSIHIMSRNNFFKHMSSASGMTTYDYIIVRYLIWKVYWIQQWRPVGFNIASCWISYHVFQLQRIALINTWMLLQQCNHVFSSGNESEWHGYPVAYFMTIS